MTSIITLMDLTILAPEHTTISRRAVRLPVIEPEAAPHGPLHLLIDSAGLRFTGRVNGWRRNTAWSRAGSAAKRWAATRC